MKYDLNEACGDILLIHEFFMKLDDILGTFENCSTIDALTKAMQQAIEQFGFASFCFVDVGHPGLDDPFTIMTNEASWDQAYRDYGFIHVDPVISVVRRTNLPFHWGRVALPERGRRKTPQVLKVMDAARDHGYHEGFVIPFHFTDSVGRVNSASCSLFWKSQQAEFAVMLKEKHHNLHVMALYWAQKVMDVASCELQRRKRFMDEDGKAIIENILTDRERDVLSWAARGKTVSETATILAISETTVETHLKHAMRKLCADNKTHAVTKAIYLGFIDV